MAAAQAKAEVGKKPIFIQPSNLANGCVLKDYQLEGVRWLVSLYENGVSGILADEMVRNTTYYLPRKSIQSHDRVNYAFRVLVKQFR